MRLMYYLMNLILVSTIFEKLPLKIKILRGLSYNLNIYLIYLNYFLPPSPS